MSALFRHEKNGGTLIIWNCNPATRNALSPEYNQGLVDGFARTASDPEICPSRLRVKLGFSALAAI